MKCRIMKKALPGTVAAACMYTNVVLASGMDLRQLKSYDDEEMVSVIVTVEGSPVLASDEAQQLGTEYLETDRAKEEAAQLEAIQEDAECYIEGFYPDLETEYSYTSLLNGFSCEIPESLVEEVEKCPQVVSVKRSHRYKKPELYEAEDMGGVGVYKESTGSYGEGETIAVLDTELDVTHDMFAPIDDKEVQFTKDDIADFINSNELNGDFDADRAYVSSKLPLVYSYTDEDHYKVADENAYHGTHVCGIAAGNRITDNDGTEISGIAPDAQIVFMDIFDYDEFLGYYADDAVIAAALEDAVKLNVSAVNLSLGSDSEITEENSALYDVYKTAEEAGIVVCAAAGNESDGNGYNAPENVDTSTVNAPSTSTSVFSVASADNSYAAVGEMILADGSRIQYTEAADGGFEWLAGEKVEYVYCGLGTPEDFEGLDLTGKIALCDRGENTFEDKALNALLAGADGMIICDNIDESLIYIDGTVIPTVFVSMSDGEKLKNSEDKTVTIESIGSIRTAVPSQVSYFSSYGVDQTLNLKPEIMGIGGNVASAGYGNNIQSMSGTSMATPYLTGCCALMSEYMKENGIDLSGAEKVRYIRNVLMNTADPYKDENGSYVSPRRQGAGLVSLADMLQAKVIMTGAEGSAKVNLYDMIGDSFDFTIDLCNLSDEDVDFTNAELYLTTDGAYYDDDYEDNVISGSTVLECSADLSSLMSVSAGEERTETVSVSLDPAQLDEISQVFTNGFFVEGYAVLSGASNSSDISIPVLGFRGDWAAVPIFDGDMIDDEKSVYNNGAVTMLGDTYYMSGMSLSGLIEFCDVISDLFGEDFDFDFDEENMVTALSEKYTAKGGLGIDLSQLEETANSVISGRYFSPNGDGMADNFGYLFYTLREAKVSGLNIYDEEGNLISEADQFNYTSKGWYSTFFDYNDYEEGKYTAEMTGYINYAGAEEQPQKKSFDFTIDMTSPKILSKSIKEENGRKILEITASDENLDGVYILGNGSGGKVGEYDPANPDESGYSLDVLEMALNVMMVQEFAYEESDGEGYGSLAKAVPFSQFITQDADEVEFENIDFLDVIRPESDEDTVTFKYDVTDLDSFSVSVVDKAYNSAVYAGGAPVIAAVKAPAEVKAGEKLQLTVPDIESEEALTKSGWQISFDGKNWSDFDPETVMTAEYNGAELRYYAESILGVGVSNTVKISVKGESDSGSSDKHTDDTSSKKAVNTASSDNPSTGAGFAAAGSAAMLGVVIYFSRKKK